MILHALFLGPTEQRRDRGGIGVDVGRVTLAVRLPHQYALGVEELREDPIGVEQSLVVGAGEIPEQADGRLHRTGVIADLLSARHGAIGVPGDLRFEVTPVDGEDLEAGRVAGGETVEVEADGGMGRVGWVCEVENGHLCPHECSTAALAARDGSGQLFLADLDDDRRQLDLSSDGCSEASIV